jgi:hypothetical protein
LNDFSAHTNVLIVGLLCTTRKGLSTSIVLWIKIPSVVKLATAVKLESQSTRRSPLPGATRSYPELPGATLVSAVRLSCWHLEAHVGSWCRHFCCNLASRWASRTTETRWDEINRVNIGVPRCSTFTA